MTDNNSNIPLRRDLGHQLLVLYGLFVGLVLLAAVIFEVLASRQLQADIFTADLALAHAVAEETQITMNNALDTVRQLAGYPDVITAMPGGMAAIFGTVMSSRNDINLTYRLDDQGIMLYHYPPEPESTVGVDFSFRDYFQRALNSREPLVSKGRISPTTNQPVATAVMPLWGAGSRFLGVVATNMKLADMSHTLTSIAGQFKPEEQLR